VKDGEAALKLLKKLKLNHPQLRIRRDGEHLLIPVRDTISKNVMETVRREVSFSEETECEVEVKPRRRTAAEILGETLPPNLWVFIPKSLDIVGHVAVLELPTELQGYKHVIGKAVLEAHKNVKTVLAKSGSIEGTYRLRLYELIGGDGRTETLHRENGCSFLLDVSKVYFSPRLAFEHRRVSEQCHEGETVLDMFAGVGPFSIQIAKKHGNVKVYSSDANPDAFAYLRRNVASNRVGDKVFPAEGDAKEVVGSLLKGEVDRVIMNLPEHSTEYVGTACDALKPQGGWIHFYKFAEEPNPESKALESLEKAVVKAGREVDEVAHTRLVKQTAPRVWLVAVDCKISPVKV